MNKAEIVQAMAEQTGETLVAMEKSLDAFLSVVEGNVRKPGGIKLVGFGSFHVAPRKARIGRNPQTGEAIPIPARDVVVFRPGKYFKDKINNQ